MRTNRPETWLSAVTMLLLRITVVAVLAYVLFRLGFIIVVVLLSAMLALAMAPLVGALQRSVLLSFVPGHHRRGWATAIVFVLLAAVLVGLGFVMVNPLAREIRELIRNWDVYQERLVSQARWAQDQWNSLPIEVRRWVQQQEPAGMGSRFGEQLQELVRRTLESGMVLVELILIPVLAFSFLTESRPLKRELAALLPPDKLRDGLSLARQTGVILQSYALGQLVLALIAGVVVWGLMLCVGVRYAVALAVIAAVTRVVPVIGPIVGAVPIVLMTALQGWDKAVAVLIAFCIMHLVESKLIMPRIIGQRINLHPAIVIIVLLVGARFFGMWGMFLAAPAAAVVKAAIHHYYVRPRQRRRTRRPPAAPTVQKEPELGHPAVAGLRSHSGAH